jgi:hypothetical protein
MIIQRTVIDPITGTAILVGQGLPNGTDAPTGSLFVRKDGGSNRMVYVKFGNNASDWELLASGSGGGTAVSASYALSSSFALSSSRAQSSVSASNMSGYIVFPNGLIVTGSVTASDSFIGKSTGTSFIGTASWANNAITASWALTPAGATGPQGVDGATGPQ